MPYVLHSGAPHATHRPNTGPSSAALAQTHRSLSSAHLTRLAVDIRPDEPWQWGGGRSLLIDERQVDRNRRRRTPRIQVTRAPAPHAVFLNHAGATRGVARARRQLLLRLKAT